MPENENEPATAVDHKETLQERWARIDREMREEHPEANGDGMDGWIGDPVKDK